MSQAPKPAPPATTLKLILQGVPPPEHPLDQVVARLEASLDRLEQKLRQMAAENGKT